MIEHDDEELSSPSLSPLSSCAGMHAFSINASLSAGVTSHDFSTKSSEECEAAQFAASEPQLWNSRAGTEQCAGCTVTSSMATTRGSQALLEAAMSSAIYHPNIVQVNNS